MHVRRVLVRPGSGFFVALRARTPHLPGMVGSFDQGGIDVLTRAAFKGLNPREVGR
jgi:hypothetical protein